MPETLFNKGEQMEQVKNSRGQMDLSVVIPVYNSVDSLQELVHRCGTACAGGAIGTYEIIFVDDASPNPDVWPMIGRLASQYEEVR